MSLMPLQLDHQELRECLDQHVEMLGAVGLLQHRSTNNKSMIHMAHMHDDNGNAMRLCSSPGQTAVGRTRPPLDARAHKHRTSTDADAAVHCGASRSPTPWWP
jgi:hypothetical protein